MTESVTRREDRGEDRGNNRSRTDRDRRRRPRRLAAVRGPGGGPVPCTGSPGVRGSGLPYQRPPLSKSFLKNLYEPLQLHRADSWYADAGITVHSADPAVALDRAGRTLLLR